VSDDIIINQPSFEVIQIDPENNSIVVEAVAYPSQMEITETGGIGPKGPAGAAIVPRARRKDWSDDLTVCYEGWAEPGSGTSDPVWRIRKTTFVGDDSSELWADGNDSYDNVWDDRLTLSYA
jgi:hypothetical protein